MLVGDRFYRDANETGSSCRSGSTDTIWLQAPHL